MHSASRITLLLALVLTLGLAACDSDPNDGEGLPLNATVVENLPADPAVNIGPMGPVGTGHFTFFSLRENEIVTDSASTDWDLGFRATDIIVNGGVSGPGEGRAQVTEGLFEEITEAPEAGWRTDNAEGHAIRTGSGNGWYNYNPQAMIVSPIPGRVILVQTADGKYAKLRIVSYYKDAPETPDIDSESRYYTFEYVFQPDGSRILE
jgi:hypothetical protein